MKRNIPDAYADLERRIEYLETKCKTHEYIEYYYIDLIKEHTAAETERVVAQLLQRPIEMTIEDIEKAFNHKIKIVGK